MPTTLTLSALDASGTLLIGAGGPLETLVTDLFLIGENFTLLPTLTIDDVVPSEFTGYADEANLVMTGPFTTPEGKLVVSGGCQAFLSTAPTPPAEFVSGVVYGWGLKTQDDPPVLQAVSKLTTPIIVQYPDVGFSVEVLVPLN